MSLSDCTPTQPTYQVSSAARLPRLLTKLLDSCLESLVLVDGGLLGVGSLLLHSALRSYGTKKSVKKPAQRGADLVGPQLGEYLPFPPS